MLRDRSAAVASLKKASVARELGVAPESGHSYVYPVILFSQTESRTLAEARRSRWPFISPSRPAGCATIGAERERWAYASAGRIHVRLP